MKHVALSLLALTASSAFATQGSEPVTAMACGMENGRFAVISIASIPASEASTKRRLEYKIELGASAPNGEIVAKRTYVMTSKALVFADQSAAYDYLEKTDVVVALRNDTGISGAVTIRKLEKDAIETKRSITVSDFATETSSEFRCIVN